MVILVGLGKPRHPLMKKGWTKLGREEKYPYIVKARYDKTTTAIIFNGERQRFSSKIRNDLKVTTLSILI